MILTAELLSFTYRSRAEPARQVFRDISLVVGAGECVAILGREGSGKSTILRLMDGLLQPDGGRVTIDGIDFCAGGKRAAALRKRIGFAFQFPEEQFVRETVALEFEENLRARGLGGGDASTAMRQALGTFGLDADLIGSLSPFALSVGEARRVALALIVAAGPEAVLLDEPTAGLDGAGIGFVTAMLQDFRRKGRAVLVSTHDIDLAAETATRVIIVGAGGIQAQGNCNTILTDATLLAAHGYRPPEAFLAGELLRKRGERIPDGIIRSGDLISAMKRSRTQ